MWAILSTVSSALCQKASVGSVHGEERSEPLPAHPAAADSEQPYMANSFADAAKLFECLIHPVKPQKFFRFVQRIQG